MITFGSEKTEVSLGAGVRIWFDEVVFKLMKVADAELTHVGLEIGAQDVNKMINTPRSESANRIMKRPANHYEVSTPGKRTHDVEPPGHAGIVDQGNIGSDCRTNLG